MLQQDWSLPSLPSDFVPLLISLYSEKGEDVVVLSRDLVRLPEEVSTIFRHELRHIRILFGVLRATLRLHQVGLRDCQTKQQCCLTQVSQSHLHFKLIMIMP